MKQIKKWRLTDEFKSSAIRYSLAVLMVFVFGAVLISVQGVNPAQALAKIVTGAFGTKAGFGSTLRYMMPCTMLGVSAMIAFKSGVYNMGIEGQMYVGSLAAAILGYQLVLPAGIHTLVCILAGGFVAILWGLIPALAKMIFDVSEMVVTMMMNFIAMLLTEYIVQWVILGGMRQSGTVVMETQTISDTAKLPILIQGTTASTGIFIALAIAISAYILFKYTVQGYELKQVGENRKFSKVGGVNVSKTFLLIFIISSFIAGVAGSVEIVGPYKRFGANYASNLPWEGIMISFIANHKPLAIIGVSFIWGALRAGALTLERTMNINRMTIFILQMLFVLFVSVNFKMIWQKLCELPSIIKGRVRKESC